MPELNYEDYLPHVLQLEDGEYEEGPGDDDPPEYLLYDEDMSDTEDGIPSQDNNRLGGKGLALWERYKPLLQHDCYSSGQIMYLDTKIYSHARVSFLYIYVSYCFIFL